MKIGVIREGKTPPDKRVPLTPQQCKLVSDNYPEVDIVVQSSEVRAFKDEQYREQGITVVTDVSDCDVLIGVKEVPIPELIANKTYFYFSHTIKMQPYNRGLLLEMMEKNIRMVDYETITAEGRRLIGFGRYAGVVGCYNGFLAYGRKTGRFDLKAAHQCDDRKEMEGEMTKVDLPKNFKVVLTGFGRVGRGAVEIVDALGLRRVEPNEFLEQEFDEPVYTQLNVTDYNARDNGAPLQRKEFFDNPEGCHSTFMRYANVAQMYVACHYWDSRSPFIFTREDVRSEQWNLSVVADISCDIDGPVATTLRPSTIADPIYGYDPLTETETDFGAKNTVGVMAVDNLPCELPKDASEDFGNEFVSKVLPELLNGDQHNIIANATICANGALTANYQYLNDYVAGTLA